MGENEVKKDWKTGSPEEIWEILKCNHTHIVGQNSVYMSLRLCFMLERQRGHFKFKKRRRKVRMHVKWLYFKPYILELYIQIILLLGCALLVCCVTNWFRPFCFLVHTFIKLYFCIYYIYLHIIIIFIKYLVVIVNHVKSVAK